MLPFLWPRSEHGTNLANYTLSPEDSVLIQSDINNKNIWIQFISNRQNLKRLCMFIIYVSSWLKTV